jgi:hypothetical protein
MAQVRKICERFEIDTGVPQRGKNAPVSDRVVAAPHADLFPFFDQRDTPLVWRVGPRAIYLFAFDVLNANEVSNTFASSLSTGSSFTSGPETTAPVISVMAMSRARK